MKILTELFIIISLIFTLRFGAIKFYQAIEKDLAIKLSKGLPSLSLYTDKLIAPSTAPSTAPSKNHIEHKKIIKK
ncbi:MAG: hypothetical protein HQK51_17665 [Oligoflexia bacterium]|nr:hypothetical protein [Oligoflexia bacterium]